jgi:invasin B
MSIEFAPHGTAFKLHDHPLPSSESRGPRPPGQPAQAMSPERLHGMARQILQAMAGNPFPAAPGSVPPPADSPRLTLPKIQLPTDPRKARDTYTLLMGTLRTLLGDNQIEEMNNRLELLQHRAQAAADGHASRSQAYLDAVAEFEAAAGAAGATGEQLRAAQERVQQAQQQLDSAEAALAELDPGSPEYAAALQARDQAREGLRQAERQLAPALAAHQASLAAAAAAGQVVDQLAEGLEAGIRGPLPTALEQGTRRELDAAATMTRLMLQFAELMGEAEARKLDFDQQLFDKMQRARQALMEKKSEEYLEAVQKAEQARKVAGCIGKVLMAVMVVAAAVATAATGGLVAGLAVAGIGATILLLEATGTVDLLGPIMDPITKGLMTVLEPLAKLLGDAWQYTPLGALVLALVPPEYEEMTKMIIGIATAMALLVVGAIAAAAAAGPLLNQVLSRVTEVVGKVLDKIMDKLISPLLEKLNGKLFDNAFSQQIKALLDQVLKKLADFNGAFKDLFSGADGQLWLSRLQSAGSAVELAGSTASSGANVASGVFGAQAARAMSEIQLLQFIGEQLKAALSQAVSGYVEQAQSTSQFINQLLSSQQESAATARFIAQQRI